MDTHSRIQELANNSEIENSRNKSHAKISEFTVSQTIASKFDFRTFSIFYNLFQTGVDRKMKFQINFLRIAVKKMPYFQIFEKC